MVKLQWMMLDQQERDSQIDSNKHTYTRINVPISHVSAKLMAATDANPKKVKSDNILGR